MNLYYQNFGGAWNTAASYISSATNYCQENISWAIDILSKNIADTDKGAAAMVTQMASSAGAKVLDFNRGVLDGVYGTISAKADDCMHEMGEFLYDLGGWLRGDDPYPKHFGASLDNDNPPDDSFMPDVSLTGVWTWLTGAGTAEPDY